MWIRIRIVLLIKAMPSKAFILSLQGSILSHHASIVSFHAYIVRVHGPPRLHLGPLKLLDFDYNGNPDLAFHSFVDTDSAY
jgi:hypothetical protein